LKANLAPYSQSSQVEEPGVFPRRLTIHEKWPIDFQRKQINELARLIVPVRKGIDEARKPIVGENISAILPANSMFSLGARMPKQKASSVGKFTGPIEYES
jgi:hypothetical protein